MVPVDRHWLSLERVYYVHDAHVRAHHEPQKPEQDQTEVLPEHQLAGSQIVFRPEHADLDDGGEGDTKSGETEGTEEGDEEAQSGDCDRQSDCKTGFKV